MQTAHSCYSKYKSNFKLTYASGPVTHVQLRQFYNAFVLHRRFIIDRLLKIYPPRVSVYKANLHYISEELNKDIPYLYHVVRHRQQQSWDNLVTCNLSYVINIIFKVKSNITKLLFAQVICNCNNITF